MDSARKSNRAPWASVSYTHLQEYGERAESPEQRLKDKDKRRAAYHRFYTDMKWGHAQNYDLTLNSGTLGIRQCVNIIKGLY